MKSYIKISLIALSLAVSGCARFGGHSAVEAIEPVMAIGDITQQQLLSNYSAFNQEFEAFTLSIEDVELVRSWPNNVRIDAFFGTWCHDSEREIPRLLKALNATVDINLIALDYSKSEPLGRALKANVKFTPTFVVYRNNKVIGQVVERPNVSLVVDIDGFIKKEAI